LFIVFGYKLSYIQNASKIAVTFYCNLMLKLKKFNNDMYFGASLGPTRGVSLGPKEATPKLKILWMDPHG